MASDTTGTAVADDKTLAERIRKGDGSAETDVFQRYSGRVFALGFVRLKDRESARELVDDVLFAVIAALRRGKVLDTKRLGAFVRGTAVNMINNQARARARRPRWDPIDDALSAVDQAASLERDCDVQLVRRCLSGFAPQEQQVLTLSLVEGLKPGEIAARLGTSSEVVRQQKSRALRRLREKLDMRTLVRRPRHRPSGRK
jgi:RNA polymerase sigma-70 factor (ECF subfamily)